VLNKGEVNRYYRLGAHARGTVTVTDYWDASEIVECRVKISPAAHDRFGGKTFTIDAQEVYTWLRLAFPLTAGDAGWDAGGNFDDPLPKRNAHGREKEAN